MLILRDPESLADLDDDFVHDLIAERFEAMADGEVFDPDLHGFAVVVAPGDSLSDLDAAVGGFLTDAGGEIESAAFEWVEVHPHWYEVTLVPGAGDFGIVVLVPRDARADEALLATCAQRAVQPEPDE